MQYISYDVKGNVACIELDRPENLNALLEPMREQIMQCVLDAQNDSAVHALIITGAGRGFCAGGDVDYMAELHEKRDVETFSGILDAANAASMAIYSCTKPTIAAVNGPAAGGGANLALACDIRIGTPGASFTQSFVRIGLGPDWGGSFLLPRIVGPDRAKELLLTGRTLAADEALSLGILHRIVDHDSLVAAAMRVASSLSDASAVAVQAIKSLCLKYPYASFKQALRAERDAQIKCFLTPQAGAAFRAFRDRSRRHSAITS